MNNRISSVVSHAFLGNDAPPEQTGLTRGLVAAALLEVVNITLLVLPISDALALQLVGHVSAIVVVVSFVAYAYLDKLLRKAGRK